MPINQERTNVIPGEMSSMFVNIWPVGIKKEIVKKFSKKGPSELNFTNYTFLYVLSNSIRYLKLAFFGKKILRNR